MRSKKPPTEIRDILSTSSPRQGSRAASQLTDPERSHGLLWAAKPEEDFEEDIPRRNRHRKNSRRKRGLYVLLKSGKRGPWRSCNTSVASTFGSTSPRVGYSLRSGWAASRD